MAEGSLADLYARGVQIRLQREGARAQREVQKSQLEQVLRERVAEDRRADPEYVNAYSRFIDPRTPREELGGLAARIGGSDMASAMDSRNQNLLKQAALDELVLTPQEMQAASDLATPGQPTPQTALPKSTVNAALGARQRYETTAATQAGQTARKEAELETRRDIAGAQQALARTRLTLQERALALREKFGDEAAANATKRTEGYLANLRRLGLAGELNTFGKIKNNLLDIMAGGAKYATEDQQQLATAAAQQAMADIDLGVSQLDAMQAAIDAFPIEPGVKGKEARERAAAGPTRQERIAKGEGLRDALAPKSAVTVEQLLERAGLPDTPENRKKAQAIIKGQK